MGVSRETSNFTSQKYAKELILSFFELYGYLYWPKPSKIVKNSHK